MLIFYVIWIGLWKMLMTLLTNVIAVMIWLTSTTMKKKTDESLVFMDEFISKMKWNVMFCWWLFKYVEHSSIYLIILLFCYSVLFMFILIFISLIFFHACFEHWNCDLTILLKTFMYLFDWKKIQLSFCTFSFPKYMLYLLMFDLTTDENIVFVLSCYERINNENINFTTEPDKNRVYLLQ